jgi:hypothetical protein
MLFPQRLEATAIQPPTETSGNELEVIGHVGTEPIATHQLKQVLDAL